MARTTETIDAASRPRQASQEQRPPLASALLREKAEALARVFAEAGHQLYAVGGSVRDELLGRPVHDLDLTTDAPPEEIKRLARQVKPDAIYDVGARFGTIGLIFRVPRTPVLDGKPPAPSGADADGGAPASTKTEGYADASADYHAPADTKTDAPSSSAEQETEQYVIEITTFRTERYLDGTRRPEVAFGTTLEEDLARRDFTINAMARDVLTGELHDPFGGMVDLRRRLIRAVGDPNERFREDPLRLLRAVRLAAQLGFEIESETRKAIAANAGALERISRERIADELNKILLSPRPAAGLRLATDLGLMAYAIPEILPMRGTSQRPMHHKDVFEHTLGVVQNVPPRLALRWAALLHDIGKPATKSVQEGAVHFFGHEEVGERMARRILQRLHFDHKLIERVCKLVRMHLRINAYDPSWTDSAVRRLIREVGDELDDLIALSRADVTSYRTERVRAAAQRADAFEQRCRELLAREDVAKLHSPLDGNELMALFSRPPGPWIRPVKDYLLGLVLEGTLGQDDKEQAIELAKQFMAEHPEL
jgi:poly(A) polymerase